jgi:hypothetical protein
MRGARSTAIVVLLALATPEWGAASAQPRVQQAGRWDEVFRVDEHHGRLLLKPTLIATGPRAIIVFDFGDMTLSSFAMDGRSQWSRGRKGAGPGEFGNPSDLFVDAEGAIHVLDPANARVTVYSHDGRYLRAVRTTERLHRLVVRSDGAIIAAPLASRFLVAFGDDGNTRHTAAIPGEMSELSSLLRENLLLHANRSTLLVLHDWSTRTFVVRPSDLTVMRAGELLAPQPFPPVLTQKVGAYAVTRVDPKAKRWLQTATLAGDTLMVVDRRPGAARSIDYYDARTLSYLASRPAPEFLVRMSVAGDLLVGLVDEPVPALVGWRWRPR